MRVEPGDLLTRRLAAVFAVAAAALAGLADAASARPDADVPRPAELRLARPALANLTGTTAPVRDSVVDRPRRFVRAASPEGWWGGPITTSTGETFTFYVSRSYEVDEEAREEWAEFLAWAYHGRELARLTLYQAPLDEVETVCGEEALACYLPKQEAIVAPGELEEDPSRFADEVLLHEYGHHVAFHRSNPPWNAYDLGTKRWASRMDVCRGVATGKLVPGGEGDEYFLDPGEAFAESYRLVNFRRVAGWGQAMPWRYPRFPTDPVTLSVVRKDVLAPWRGPTTTRWTGRVGARRSAARRVALPLDGNFSITLTGLARGSVAVSSDAGDSASARRRVTGTACGERSLVVRVRSAAAGRFSVAIRRP